MLVRTVRALWADTDTCNMRVVPCAELQCTAQNGHMPELVLTWSRFCYRMLRGVTNRSHTHTAHTHTHTHTLTKSGWQHSLRTAVMAASTVSSGSRGPAVLLSCVAVWLHALPEGGALRLPAALPLALPLALPPLPLGLPPWVGAGTGGSACEHARYEEHSCNVTVCMLAVYHLGGCWDRGQCL